MVGLRDDADQALVKGQKGLTVWKQRSSGEIFGESFKIFREVRTRRVTIYMPSTTIMALGLSVAGQMTR